MYIYKYEHIQECRPQGQSSNGMYNDIYLLCKVHLCMFLQVGIQRGQPPNICKLCLLLPPCLFVCSPQQSQTAGNVLSCFLIISLLGYLRFSQVMSSFLCNLCLLLPPCLFVCCPRPQQSQTNGRPQGHRCLCVLMPWRSKIKLNCHFKVWVENLGWLFKPKKQPKLNLIWKDKTTGLIMCLSMNFKFENFNYILHWLIWKYKNFTRALELSNRVNFAQHFLTFCGWRKFCWNPTQEDFVRRQTK